MKILLGSKNRQLSKCEDKSFIKKSTDVYHMEKNQWKGLFNGINITKKLSSGAVHCILLLRLNLGATWWCYL